MDTFSIYSRQGANLGIWDAVSETHAVYQMHVDAGYGHVVRYDDMRDRMFFANDEYADLCGDVTNFDIERVD